MNAPADPFALMDDRDLAETIFRLAATVIELSKSDTEIALRIRNGHTDALDRARIEMERRQC